MIWVGKWLQKMYSAEKLMILVLILSVNNKEKGNGNHMKDEEAAERVVKENPL